MDFKNPETKEADWISSDALKDMYLGFIKDYPVVSIEDPFDQDDWEYLIWRGMCYAQLENKAEVEQVIGQLYEERKPRFGYGVTERQHAAILAWSGQPKEAIDLLAEAAQNGTRYFYHRFAGEWIYQPLFDEPDFKNQLMAPKPLPTTH